MYTTLIVYATRSLLAADTNAGRIGAANKQIGTKTVAISQPRLIIPGFQAKFEIAPTRLQITRSIASTRESEFGWYKAKAVITYTIPKPNPANPSSIGS